MTSSDRLTRAEADAQGAKAVAYWTSHGALNVRHETFQVVGRKGNYEGWSHRLTGMHPEKAVPLEWVPGAARVWARKVGRGR